MSVAVTGWARHVAAAADVVDQLAALSDDAPVRLAKKTTNLFRPRRATGSRGLDVSRLTGVIALDPVARVADVQGMCTYEHLVEVTLAQGLMPAVVPQLKTITLGGAVTGLGIESRSFRDGLPHETVREMDVLTGRGDVVTATPDGEASDLFRAFPNSYGSLGYAVRLAIDLVPTLPYVRLRHIRHSSVAELARHLQRLVTERRHEGAAVDFLDAVVFSATESYVVVGAFADDAPYVSDYTGERIYYRSIQERTEDYLTIHDYLWRWDTDWFWCSRAFGVQRPGVRRFVPRRLLRSDVYGRIVRFENRFGLMATRDRRRGMAPKERVVQDVEVPIERCAEFVTWFLDSVPIEPIWLCPLRVRDEAHGARPWPLYPLSVGRDYVNVGFWSAVQIAPGGRDGDVNRAIEAKVGELEGHKSLYSDAYYDPDEFAALYGGEEYARVKKIYDPDGRLPDLYSKAVGRR